MITLNEPLTFIASVLSITLWSFGIADFCEKSDYPISLVSSVTCIMIGGIIGLLVKNIQYNKRTIILGIALTISYYIIRYIKEKIEDTIYIKRKEKLKQQKTED